MPAPAPATLPSTKSEGPGSIGPPTAGAPSKDLTLHVRQRDAIVTKEFSLVNSRLKTAEREIETQRLTIIELQSRDEESKKEREEFALRLNATQAQTDHLQSLLSTYLKSQGVQTSDLGGASTVSELIVGNVEALSVEDSRKLTEIMNESLATLYGVKKFSPKEHGQYPQVSKSHMEWPSQNKGGVKKPLHRFKWDEPYNSPVNQPTFNAWVDHSITKGPGLTGHLDLPSSVLNQRVVSSQCSKRYLAIKQQVVRYYGEKKQQVVGIKRRGEGLDAPEGSINRAELPTKDTVNVGPGDQVYDNPGYDGAPLGDPSLLRIPAQADGVVDLPTLDGAPQDTKPAVLDSPAKDFNLRNNIRSRKNTKLGTRIRQQQHLSGDDAKFQASKYDTYETIGAMSDDERVDSVNEKGETVTTFILHAYDFLSQEMIDCRDAIDRVPDPTKASKKVIRQRGSLQSDPPPKAKIAGGLRTWMIKPEVLAANPQWITEGRVYRSGPEWGKAEGEEQATHKPKKLKLETNPDLQAVQQTEGVWLEAKQKYTNWMKSWAYGTEAGGSESGPS
ncbi:hypothetical protein RhiTH_004574 [Rhizoctonia solani]